VVLTAPALAARFAPPPAEVVAAGPLAGPAARRPVQPTASQGGAQG